MKYLPTLRLVGYAPSPLSSRAGKWGSWLLSGMILLLLAVSGTRYAAAGGLDPTFNAHIETSRFLSKSVKKLIVCPDGKILAFGEFNTYNGQPVGGVIRLNADATLDPTFNNYGFGASVVPTDVSLLPDGKVLMSGTFTLADGTVYTNRIVRLNADGTLDDTFVNQLTGSVGGFRVDLFGRIVLSGELHYNQGGIDVPVSVARLFANGERDASFVAAPISSGANGIRIFLQGNKPIYNVFDTAIQKYKIYRLNEDGSVDSTFTPTISGGWYMMDAKEQTDHKLLILQSARLIRVNADGGLDPGFTIPPTFNWNASMLHLSSDGRITIAYTNVSPTSSPVKRLLPDGTADPTFTTYSYVGATTQTAVFAVMNDGGVLIGDSTQDAGTNQFMRLGPNGSPDNSFNSGGSGFQTVGTARIRAIKATPEGKILIGGNFDRVNGLSRPRLARLNEDSSIDTSFQVNTTATGNYFSVLSDIYNVTIQSDGKILISGSFTYYVNGQQKINVVRLLPSGSIDPTFIPSLLLNDWFGSNLQASNKPVQRPDLKILIGTTRTSPTDTMNAPLQLSAGGVRDTSFSPSLFASKSTLNVYDLAVLPNGKILISGGWVIASVNGETSKGFIARLNADGTTDSSFQLFEIDNKIVPMFSLLPSGQILYVTRTATQSTVSRMGPDGAPDPAFNPASTANGKINAIAVLPTGKIVVVGSFATYMQSARRNLAQLNADGSLDNDIGAANDEVFCVTVDDQGRILVGGQFTSVYVGGQQTGIPYLVRLTASAPVQSTIFDYDGDGKSDESVFRPSDNVWYLNRSQAGFAALQFGAAGDLLAPADFTGDGKADIAVFRPSSGTWFVLRSEDNTFYGVNFGSNGDIPAPGDFDGDGRADQAVFRPSQGTWFLQQSTAGFSAVQFGVNGDVPTVGDFDGDGKKDVAVYRPSNGSWFRLNSSNGSFFGAQFGQNGDKVVPADYSGDGKTDLAVWRPSDGTWYIQRSEDNSFYGQQFGQTGDLPAPGDYDGDGKADVAVFRPAGGIWFEQRSTTGFAAVQFGANGDKPAPGAFVY